MKEGIQRQCRHSQVLDEASTTHKAKPKQSKKDQHAHDRIVLCIGGRILETSKQTLCVDSDSMLSAWVQRHLHRSSDGNGGFYSSKNDDGSKDADADHGGYDDEEGHVLWIDRDAHRFDHVLNYLRNGTIWLEDTASLRAVQEEAVFFGLAGLETLCEERIQALESLKRQRSQEIQEAIRDAIADFCKNHFPCSSPLSSSNSRKGEVLAILRARRLGASNASNDPVFQIDEDF